MNFEEFLEKKPVEEPELESVEEGEELEDEADATENIEVQKAVVESLAAEKVAQEEVIENLRSENDKLQKEIGELKAALEKKESECRSRISPIETEISELKAKLESQSRSLAEMGDVLAKNSESPLSNQVALLERSIEIEDRFPGETREHVIEAVREARDKAEQEGRLRRAQVLESVLVANSSEGTLAKKRADLEKLFADNGNILSGTVIEQLAGMGLSHKNGEDYLLPAEIINRNY